MREVGVAPNHDMRRGRAFPGPAMSGDGASLRIARQMPRNRQVGAVRAVSRVGGIVREV
jgi:hypothetical protein